MATTPEGRVKAEVTKILKSFHPYLWHVMPVPSGFGKPMLDYHGVVLGIAFAIETKAPGKKPTPRQKLTIRELTKAGCRVFVIDGKQEDYDRLIEWIEEVMGDRAHVIAHLADSDIG